MKVSEVMSAGPAFCTVGTAMSVVAKMMRDRDCGAIPVFDTGSGRKPVGMITDRDITVRLVAQGRDSMRCVARDAMTPTAVVIGKAAEAADAARAMRQHRGKAKPRTRRTSIGRSAARDFSGQRSGGRYAGAQNIAVMTRMIPLLKWLPPVLLAIALAAGAPQARAQMTGKLSIDAEILDRALAATVAATGKADQDASRLAMQKLYQLWLEFRAKNFRARAGDSPFLHDMKIIEARLFAASKLIDNGQLAKAHGALLTAGSRLLSVRQREAAPANPRGTLLRWSAQHTWYPGAD